MKISLCMIVKDEEKCLANCLDAVHDLVDEIVIVDTGSTDKTKEIAGRYTDKIYDFEWINDFSAARNFAFSKGTMDYLMWLDADDIITEENRQALRKLKETVKNQYDVIIMAYQMTGGDSIIDTFFRERIVKRKLNLRWEGEIHEIIQCNLVPEKRKLTVDTAITHTKKHEKSVRNLTMLEEQIEKGGPTLRLLYYYAQELYSHERYEEAIGAYEEFFGMGGGETPYCLYSCMHLHNLYLRQNQPGKAIAISLKCIKGCSDRSEFCCQLGDYYKDVSKDVEEAIKWYERATKCPRQTKVYKNTLERFYYYVPYYNLGQLYGAQGRLPEARDCLQKALEYLKKTKK